MADEEHVALLKQGVEVWNKWREVNPDITVDLSDASLNRVDLSVANLDGTDLTGAFLTGTDLRRANLTDAFLSRAVLWETVFANTDLTRTKGLETCRHMGPSTIDHRTLQRSGPLPPAFLRGVGLPERLIEYLPSILEQAIQFYSCFISYSSKDQDFADRLHADLQNKGVRCWFAPHDMRTGDRIRDVIDAQIRVREKLLVVLSSASIESEWVEDEVEAALEEERKSKNHRTVLFPIQIDDAVKNTDRAWAGKIRRTRHITDLTRWKDHDAYRKALDRLLRDLKVAQAEP